MKKILAAIVAATMCLSVLTACVSNSDSSSQSQNTSDTNSSEAETTYAAKVINVNLTNEEYAFGVDKTNSELISQVNTFIDEIMNSGKFTEICNMYFGDEKPLPVESAAYDKSKDQLVVATNAEFAPFEYKEGNNYYGIDLEIASRLAKKLGKELVIQNMAFDDVCTSVAQHKCDIAMAALTINDERKKDVTFSNMYYKASQQIICKSDDTTFDNCITKESINEILAGKDKNTKIGVQKGTTGQKYVEGAKEDGYNGFSVSCEEYDNASDAIKDMIDGKIDYVIVDSAPAETLVKQAGK